MPIAMHRGCAACLPAELETTAEEQTLTLLWMLASGRHTAAGMVADLCEPHRRKVVRLMDEAYAGGAD